jgi:hypothetical protein
MYLLCFSTCHFSAFQAIHYPALEAIHFPALQAKNPRPAEYTEPWQNCADNMEHLAIAQPLSVPSRIEESMKQTTMPPHRNASMLADIDDR